MTPENAATVAELCHWLDGLLLAIELSSARVNALSIEQINNAWPTHLICLSPATRTDQRHRTLRAAIDWSYDLLLPDEQLLLRGCPQIIRTLSTTLASLAGR